MRFTAFFSIACLLALLGGSSSSSSEESKEIPSKSFTWNFFGKCCDKLKCPKNPVLAYYTTTTTSVASIYCTKSTNQVCATRRSLRGFSTDNDSDEQFPISPSAVQGVEPTIETIPNIREKEPQLSWGTSPEIQSAFQSDFSTDRNSVPPFASSPFLSRAMKYSAAERSASTSTIWFTSVLFSLTTITVSPTCSQAGPQLQCPSDN